MTPLINEGIKGPKAAGFLINKANVGSLLFFESVKEVKQLQSLRQQGEHSEHAVAPWADTKIQVLE